MTKLLPLPLLRLYYRLTGRCLRFAPDARGLCRSCRVEPAGGLPPVRPTA